MDEQKTVACAWFKELQDKFTGAFEALEDTYATSHPGLDPGRFKEKKWTRDGGGGGEMRVMRGHVFEKVGVNFSCVYGALNPAFAKKISDETKLSNFWASGVSLVAHLNNPFVPAMHMNTRFIITTTSWFGGGGDMTPYFPDPEDAAAFHGALEAACSKTDPTYYTTFKEWCDRYFYLPHREEARGIGGIFYDNLNSGNWSNDFIFTQDVGKALVEVYPKIVERNMFKEWTAAQREHQLIRRGRYVEFNLLYDRGTDFGLQTGGNIEAILMSMPPEVKWP